MVRIILQQCKDYVIYVRAIQGHTGRNMISLELMGHVRILYNWMEFVFHRGCSHDMIYIFDKGHIPGGGEKKKEDR